MTVLNTHNTTCPYCNSKEKFEIVNESSSDDTFTISFLRCNGNDCKKFLGIISQEDKHLHIKKFNQ